jgi:hypothetical protein
VFSNCSTLNVRYNLNRVHQVSQLRRELVYKMPKQILADKNLLTQFYLLLRITE